MLYEYILASLIVVLVIFQVLPVETFCFLDIICDVLMYEFYIFLVLLVW